MKKESERWFASYLDLNETAYEFEPTLGGSSNPDFLINKSGFQAICEVKEFETLGIFRDYDFSKGEVISRPAAAALKPVRSQIDSAAKQLKEYRDQNLPLIAILANPLKAQVTLNDSMVISAMFGDPSTTFMLDGDGLTRSIDLAGRNGALTNNHKYLSGVVVLEKVSKNETRLIACIEKLTEDDSSLHGTKLLEIFREIESTFEEDEITFNCTVFENYSAECVPIPDSLFSSIADRRYRPINGVIHLRS